MAATGVIHGVNDTLSENSLVVYPQGSGADDWAGLRAAMGQMAYRGEVVMAPGTWYCKTSQEIPNGTVLRMNPGVTIVSSLVDNAPTDFLGCVFFNLGARALSDTTTLATPVAEGASSFLVPPTSPLVVGNRFLIQNVVAYWEQREVMAVAASNLTFTADSSTDGATSSAHGMTNGDGPYQTSNSGGALPGNLTPGTNYWVNVVDANTYRFSTSRANALANTYIDLSSNGTGTQTLLRTLITIDRPTLHPFLATNGLVLLTTARDIYIYGNGATVTGTGTAVVEIAGGRDCYISDIHADVTMQFGFCLDVGSRDCIFERCTIDGNSACGSTLLLALSENCVLRDCNSIKASSYGLYMASCDNCLVVGGTISGSGSSGITLASDHASNTYGCRNCVISGTKVLGSTTFGIWVLTYGTGNTFRDVEVSGGPTGIYLQGSTIADTKIYGGICRKQSQVGVLNGGAIRTKVVGHTSDNMESYESQAGGDLTVSGASVTDTGAVVVSTAMALVTGSGSTLRLTDCDFKTTRGAQHAIRQSHANSRLYVNGVKYTSSSINGFGLLADSGVSWLQGFVTDTAGSGGQGIYLNGATAYCRIGEGCDFSLAATATGAPGGGYFNRGTVTLNGATGVDITFPATTAQDRLWLVKKTAGGTPGVAPTWTRTPGTKFTVSGVALDTSIYEYEIRP